MPRAHLAILQPGRDLQLVEINGTMRLGSGLDATVRLAGPGIEPAHADLLVEDGAHVLRRIAGDVLVNSKRTKHRVLEPQDLIVIGQSAIVYRVGAIPARAPESAAVGEAPLEMLQQLLSFSRLVATDRSWDTLRDRLLGDVLHLTGGERGVVVLADRHQLHNAGMKTSASRDFDEEEARSSRTLMARILEERRPFLVGSVSDDTQLKNAPSLRGSSARSIMAAPIYAGARIIGALYVSRHQSQTPFAQRDLDLMSLYAAQIAHLLESDAMRRDLRARADAAEKRLRKGALQPVIGSAPALKLAVAAMKKASAPVIVCGERGTGKKLLAKHYLKVSYLVATPETLDAVRAESPAAQVIVVPPLRDRGQDAVEIAQHFAEQHATLQGRALNLSAAALAAIQNHRWPGNVAELETAIQRAAELATGEVIKPEHLDLDTDPASGERVVPLDQARDDFLKRYVTRVVDACGGNRGEAARVLQVTPRTIFKYLEEV